MVGLKTQRGIGFSAPATRHDKPARLRHQKYFIIFPGARESAGHAPSKGPREGAFLPLHHHLPILGSMQHHPNACLCFCLSASLDLGMSSLVFPPEAIMGLRAALI